MIRLCIRNQRTCLEIKQIVNIHLEVMNSIESDHEIFSSALTPERAWRLINESLSRQAVLKYSRPETRFAAHWLQIGRFLLQLNDEMFQESQM